MMKLFPAVGRCLLVSATLTFGCALLRGQTIIRSFPGVSLNDTVTLGNVASTPPDTMGAAGPNQFVEFINGAFAIYSKTGVQQALIGDFTFWENAGISASTRSEEH